MRTIFTLYLVSSVLLVGLSIPMILGRVKPNPLYGFRTPKTLGNEQVWYAANNYSGRWLLGAGILGVVLALALAPMGFRPGGLNAYCITWSVVTMGAILVGVVMSFLYLSRL